MKKIITILLQHKLPLIICFCLFSVQSKAQDDCATTLSKAQKQYDAGVIEQIPQLLSGCLNSGFTNEEEIQAQKLIILSLLFNNNKKEAEEHMAKFLQKNPEYTPASNDQAEFVQLLKKFNTQPSYALGISVGTLFPKISTINTWGVYNTNETKSSYLSSTGFFASINLEFYLKHRLNLHIDPAYQQYTFTNTLSNLYDYIQTVGTENHKKISLPISLTYLLPEFKKFTPYIRAGLIADYLLQANLSLERSENTGKPTTSPSYSIVTNRKKVTLSGLVGAGIQYKIKHAYLFFDFRYNQAFMNSVNTSSRFTTDQSNFLYKDNDFRNNSLTFSVGVMYLFYNSKQN